MSARNFTRGFRRTHRLDSRGSFRAPFVPLDGRRAGGAGSGIHLLSHPHRRNPFLVFATVGFLRGIQDTRTPMLVAFLINGLNVVLDYLLIYGGLGLPAMGLRGAGFAILISQVLAGTICFGILFLSSYASQYGLN